MTNLPGVSVSDVQPGQIVTFGNRSRLLRREQDWRFVLRVEHADGRVTVRSLWHRRKTVPADTRVWLWVS